MTTCESSDSGTGRLASCSKETGFVYEDEGFDDFDAQAEQLPGYDQTYIKTSTGRFRGRRTSADLANGVSINLETVNCAMYQQVGCPDGCIGLGVSLGPPGTVVNGVELDRSHLVMTGPGSELELDVVAEGGKFLVLSVERRALGGRPCEETRAGEVRLERGTPSIVHTVYTARGLTEAAMGLLQICGRAPEAVLPTRPLTTLLDAIVAAIEFELSLTSEGGREQRSPSFDTFAEARKRLTAMEELDYRELAAATGRGPRAIQMAFARHARTTPLRYFRALKLHRVRDTLLNDSGDRPATIGDIAAAHGFSSWSRFTQLYRLQFGEMPSETRARGLARSR